MFQARGRRLVVRYAANADEGVVEERLQVVATLHGERRTPEALLVARRACEAGGHHVPSQMGAVRCKGGLHVAAECGEADLGPRRMSSLLDSSDVQRTCAKRIKVRKFYAS